MEKVINGELIIRSEPDKREKKVRRQRKKTNKKTQSKAKPSQDIITKPAT